VTNKKTKSPKKATEYEAHFVSTIMSPHQAAILASRTDMRVNQYLGRFNLPLVVLFDVNVLCMEMFAKGAIWARVPEHLQDDCLHDIATAEKK
jgi:hypothetical protein